jgi:hypothetical protein
MEDHVYSYGHSLAHRRLIAALVIEERQNVNNPPN